MFRCSSKELHGFSMENRDLARSELGKIWKTHGFPGETIMSMSISNGFGRGT